MGSVAIKSVDARAVRQAVDDLARTIFDTRPEVREIVVFGSFERGDYAPGSDVDLFLSLEQSNKPARERPSDYLPARFPVGLDLFPFTDEEAAALEPSPILDAVRTSRWRYRRREDDRNAPTG